jgi:hypothetical protein
MIELPEYKDNEGVYEWKVCAEYLRRVMSRKVAIRLIMNNAIAISVIEIVISDRF